MSQEYGRHQRVGDFLARELAVVIQQQMRDPRVRGVSVVDLEVSRDLAHARVFVRLMGVQDRDEIDATIAVLQKAAGFLRSQIAKQMTARTTPALHFAYDDSGERGDQLDALIAKARAADQARHE